MSELSQRASYILHYTPWRDTSFIVDLFTLEHGRLGLVARGARSARPATRALYQPFRPLLVSWSGEGELRTLVGIEESGAPLALEGAALGCAYYLNELVLRLLGKEQPQPALFAHYALALATLEGASGAGRETALRTFELQLLETVGVLPDLARCAPGGEPVEPGRRYRFDPANAVAEPLADAVEPVYGIPKRRGGADGVGEGHGADAEGHSGDGSGVGVEVRGRTLLDMAALDFDDAPTREEAKRLMRRLIAEQLGGRPLRSRSLFEALVPPAPEGAADATGEGRADADEADADGADADGADRDGAGEDATGADGADADGVNGDDASRSQRPA